MFVVVKELMGLPGLPATTKGIRESLERASGGSSELVRKREGSKAFEYHIDCLPAAAREVVLARRAEAVLQKSGVQESLPLTPVVSGSGDAAAGTTVGTIKVSAELEIMRKCPALLERRLGSLTDGQRQTADARITLVLEVQRLMSELGMNRKKAVALISERSRQGTLPERVQKAADMANARKGSTRRGVGVRTLQKLVSDFMTTGSIGERLAIMAPDKIQAKPLEAYPWLREFLKHYQLTCRPTVAMAYENFKIEWMQVNGGNALMLSQILG